MAGNFMASRIEQLKRKKPSKGRIVIGADITFPGAIYFEDTATGRRATLGDVLIALNALCAWPYGCFIEKLFSDGEQKRAKRSKR